MFCFCEFFHYAKENAIFCVSVFDKSLLSLDRVFELIFFLYVFNSVEQSITYFCEVMNSSTCFCFFFLIIWPGIWPWTWETSPHRWIGRCSTASARRIWWTRTGSAIMKIKTNYWLKICFGLLTLRFEENRLLQSTCLCCDHAVHLPCLLEHVHMQLLPIHIKKMNSTILRIISPQM